MIHVRRDAHSPPGGYGHRRCGGHIFHHWRMFIAETWAFPLRAKLHRHQYHSDHSQQLLIFEGHGRSMNAASVGRNWKTLRLALMDGTWAAR